MSAIAGVSTTAAAYRPQGSAAVRKPAVQSKVAEEQNERAAEKAAEKASGSDEKIDLRA